MTKPLFILGNPRSGTSLLRLMLTCHQRICVPPECAFIVWWHAKYAIARLPLDDESLEEFLRDLYTSRKFEHWDLPMYGLKEHLKKASPDTYSALVAEVYLYYANKEKKVNPAYWGDKNNYYVAHVETLFDLFPDARFVQIVRDGRDVATSYLALTNSQATSRYHPNLPSDINEIAMEWHTNNKAVRDSFNRIPGDQTHLIRYEDIVSNPEVHLRELCDFLELDFDKQMMKYYQVNRESNLEPSEYKAWKAKTFEPLEKSGVGRYTSELSELQLNVFERVAGESLRIYGYMD